MTLASVSAEVPLSKEVRGSTEDEEGGNMVLMDWDECVKDEKGRAPRKGRDRLNR